MEARTLADAAGRRFTVALLARRSRLHPGMRYIARGLNALASPGNEIECEQLVWADGAPARGGSPVLPDRNGAAASAPAGGEGEGVGSRDGGGEGGAPGGACVRWSSFLWRRGTVPIWWGVELRSGGVGEANIVVSPSRPYRGTRRRGPRAHAPAVTPGMSVAAAYGARTWGLGKPCSTSEETAGCACARIAMTCRPLVCRKSKPGTRSACYIISMGNQHFRPLERSKGTLNALPRVDR